MIRNINIYTSKEDLLNELQNITGIQAKAILNEIKAIQGQYNNVILIKYLNTLSDQIIYSLGLNVLYCIEE